MRCQELAHNKASSELLLFPEQRMLAQQELPAMRKDSAYALEEALEKSLRILFSRQRNLSACSQDAPFCSHSSSFKLLSSTVCRRIKYSVLVNKLTVESIVKQYIIRVCGPSSRPKSINVRRTHSSYYYVALAVYLQLGLWQW